MIISVLSLRANSLRANREEEEEEEEGLVLTLMIISVRMFLLRSARYVARKASSRRDLCWSRMRWNCWMSLFWYAARMLVMPTMSALSL